MWLVILPCSGGAVAHFKRLREEYAEICVPTLVLSEKQDFFSAAISLFNVVDTSGASEIVPPQCGSSVPFDVTHAQIVRPASERDLVFLTVAAFLRDPRAFVTPLD